VSCGQSDHERLVKEKLVFEAVLPDRRAHEATTSGHFAKELIPVPLKDADGNLTGETLDRDEGIRPDANVEALAKLQPAQSWEPDTAKDITAGNSSQMTDGAAAMLIASKATANAGRASAQGDRPAARITVSSRSVAMR